MPLLFVSGYDFLLGYGDNNKTGSLLHNEMTAPKVQMLGEYSAQRHLREECSHGEMQKQVPTTEIQPEDSFRKPWPWLGMSKEFHTVKLGNFGYLAISKACTFFHSLLEMVSQRISLLEFSLHSNLPPQRSDWSSPLES